MEASGIYPHKQYIETNSNNDQSHVSHISHNAFIKTVQQKQPNLYANLHSPKTRSRHAGRNQDLDKICPPDITIAKQNSREQVGGERTSKLKKLDITLTKKNDKSKADEVSVFSDLVK